MSDILLDTVGLLALWEQTDQWHAPAEAAMAALRGPRIRLVTTSFILLECGNAAARKPYRADVVQLWRALEADGRLITPTEDDIQHAWDGYAGSHAAGAGIVDHVSFAVMRRLGIADAFTNDKHFRAAGFTTLF